MTCLRREKIFTAFPALKRRSKFMPTLRVEETCSEFSLVCRVVEERLAKKQESYTNRNDKLRFIGHEEHAPL